MVISAYRFAPLFAKLFAGVGGPLPVVTRLFFASYRFWGIVPAVVALLSLDVLRRERASLIYFTVVVIGTLGSALVLHAWLYEAFFQPLFTIIKAIG